MRLCTFILIVIRGEIILEDSKYKMFFSYTISSLNNFSNCIIITGEIPRSAFSVLASFRVASWQIENIVINKFLQLTQNCQTSRCALLQFHHRFMALLSKPNDIEVRYGAKIRNWPHYPSFYHELMSCFGMTVNFEQMPLIF